MSNNTFIDKCIEGSALVFEIDNYLEKWHLEDVNLEIHEYLGMTDTEYNAWMLDDSVLPFIIKAHKDNTTFEEMSSTNYDLIAARNSSSKKVSSIINWLKENE